MNTSNPFSIETIARERQAELGRPLRQAAQLRDARPMRAPSPLRRRLGIGIASLSLIGVITAIITSQLY